jgi:peptidoglycan L-alanyl-D-glutamate endopeptidase CwlK
MSLRDQIKKIQSLVGATADGLFGPTTARKVIAALQPDIILEEGALDNRTKRNLSTLEPKAQDKFRKFIFHAKSIAASLGVDYVAISGTRGREEQNGLYAKGRAAPGKKVTNARYGYSNHNFGIALDFGVFADRKYLDSSDPKRAAGVHRSVAEVADQYGIEWGGNWRTFKDYPHFEIKTKLSTAEKRARLYAGESIL